MVARADAAAADEEVAAAVTEPAAEPAPEPPNPAQRHWRDLVHQLQRVRRLQRIRGHLGSHLRTSWPANHRDRLRDFYP